jgi:DNA-binding NarL/FixJ family response regulator
MAQEQSIRLLIAEDQPMIRNALANLLELEPDFDVVASVGDGQEAVVATRAYRPDVILMDIKMPRMDGVAATRAIMREYPEARVIVLTTFENDDYVFEAVMAGARAYLLKDAEEREIVEAIHSVMRGESRLSPRVAEKLVGEFRRMKAQDQAGAGLEEDLLTERERDVLSGVAAGKNNRDIARELNLAEGTVKNHVSAILSKLHLRSRTELAVKAKGAR